MNYHRWALGLLGALLLLVFGFELFFGTGAARATLGGALVPAAISWASMALLAKRGRRLDPQRYQHNMLLNFLVKILVISVWVVVALRTTDWPVGFFIASLLINFFIWHLLEAWVYQRQLLDRGSTAE